MVLAPETRGASGNAPDATELLIVEARRKSRQRRFRIGLTVVVVVALVATLVAVLERHVGGAAPSSGGGSVAAAGTSSAANGAFAPFYFPPNQILQFASPERGWLVDLNNPQRILGTTDGGRTWVTRYQGSIRSGYNVGSVESIDFVNATNGWALLYGRGLMSTRDGGVTWSTAREPPQGAVMNYSFSGARTGWALTTKGVLLQTTNGATTWRRVATPIAATSLCATPSGSVWLGQSDSGNVYVSRGGESWHLSLAGASVPAARNVPRRDPAPWISCANHAAWLLYDYGESAGSMPYVVERTTDGGVTWKPVVTTQVTPVVRGDRAALFATVNDFGVTGPTSAWITGFCGPCTTGGAATATTSNALTFVRHPLSTSTSSYVMPLDTVFRTPRTGWALLQESTLSSHPAVSLVVVATTDGGVTWKVVSRNPGS